MIGTTLGLVLIAFYCFCLYRNALITLVINVLVLLSCFLFLWNQSEFDHLFADPANASRKPAKNEECNQPTGLKMNLLLFIKFIKFLVGLMVIVVLFLVFCGFNLYLFFYCLEKYPLKFFATIVLLVSVPLVLLVFKEWCKYQVNAFDQSAKKEEYNQQDGDKLVALTPSKNSKKHESQCSLVKMNKSVPLSNKEIEDISDGLLSKTSKSDWMNKNNLINLLKKQLEEKELELKNETENHERERSRITVMIERAKEQKDKMEQLEARLQKLEEYKQT